MKTKIIPFDLETAKKIQAGEVEGRILTKEGDFTARIICFDKVKLVNGDGITENQIVSLIYNDIAREDVLYIHNQKGEVHTAFNLEHAYDLVLEVPDEFPDNIPQFKPFDWVLVKKNGNHGETLEAWTLAIFQNYETDYGDRMYIASGAQWHRCIPYEGNEHLAGTTDEPEED